MITQLGAIPAAVRSVVFGATSNVRFRTFAGLATVTVLLVGCIPTGGTLVGADPADPTSKVAAEGYRSTVAPYTSLRPTPPQGWREQNQRVAPSPKSAQ